MKGRKPKEIAEKKPVNQVVLDPANLEFWVKELAYCLTLFVLIDVTVGNQDAAYSRNLLFDTPSEMVKAHEEAIKGYIYCIANKSPLPMEIPVPLYCLLAPLCDYEINCTNGRVSARYNLDASWLHVVNPGMKALFSRDGYYACKYGWKFYTSEGYKTKQGRLKDVTYLTGVYLKEGTPVELRTRRISTENYQFIDVSGNILGHSLRGSELNKELVMGHLRVLPSINYSSSAKLGRLLPGYRPVIFGNEDTDDRAIRAADVLLQGGSSSIMGICGKIDLAYNPDLAEYGALSFLMPLLITPVSSLPGMISNLPTPSGLATVIIAGVMTHSPTTVWKAVKEVNGGTITPDKFAKLCSTLARKSAGDTHLPINISDSVAAHRPVFALNTHRVGVEAGFIHQKAFFEVEKVTTSSKYGDAFKTIITLIATEESAPGAPAITAGDKTAVTAGFIERVLKAVDNCTQEMHDIMASAPMLSDDIMTTPLSSKVLVQANLPLGDVNKWEYEVPPKELHDMDDNEMVSLTRAVRISLMLRKNMSDRKDGWELFKGGTAADKTDSSPKSNDGVYLVGDDALGIADKAHGVSKEIAYKPEFIQNVINKLMRRAGPASNQTNQCRRLYSRHARIISQAREVHFFSSCYIFPLVGSFEDAKLEDSNLEALGFEQVGTAMGDIKTTISMGSVISPNRDDPSGQRKQLIANIGKYAGLGSLFGKALNLGKKFVGSETGQQLLGKAAGLALGAASNSDNKILRGAAGVIGHFIT